MRKKQLEPHATKAKPRTSQSISMARHCATVVALMVLALATSPAWASWTLVQHVYSASNCTTTTCSITVSAIGTNHAIAVVGGVSSTSDAISSVSDGHSTYLVPSACVAHDSGATRSVYCGYTPCSVSGGTSVTVTRSATTAARFEVWEFSSSKSGCPTLDSGAVPINATDNSTNSSSPAGTTLTLNASSSDAIVQWIYSSVNISSVSFNVCSATATTDLVSGWGWTNVINVVNCGGSGNSPTWTLASATHSVVGGIAFAEPSSSSIQQTLPLLGVGE